MALSGEPTSCVWSHQWFSTSFYWLAISGPPEPLARRTSPECGKLYDAKLRHGRHRATDWLKADFVSSSPYARYVGRGTEETALVESMSFEAPGCMEIEIRTQCFKARIDSCRLTGPGSEKPSTVQLAGRGPHFREGGQFDGQHSQASWHRTTGLEEA